VVKLLREGLDEAHQVKEIDEIKGEFLAIDQALSKLEPGDICLILVDQVEEALAHIQKRVAEASA
jgi:cyanophycin synthetase